MDYYKSTILPKITLVGNGNKWEISSFDFAACTSEDRELDEQSEMQMGQVARSELQFQLIHKVETLSQWQVGKSQRKTCYSLGTNI